MKSGEKKQKNCHTTHGPSRASQGSLDDRKLTVCIHVKNQLKLIYKGQSTPFQTNSGTVSRTGVIVLGY